MPTEPDPLNNRESDASQWSPGLAQLEERLRNLHPSKSPKLDRDELMFQSGYAAALATMSDRRENAKQSANWGWPVLSGTLATIAAALAVVLWVSPKAVNDSQTISRPEAEVSPQLVDTNQPVPKAAAGSEESPVSNHPIQEVVAPYLKNMLGRYSSSTVLGLRMRLARSMELEELPRPRLDSISPFRPREPLKANSYRNQELWEQL